MKLLSVSAYYAKVLKCPMKNIGWSWGASCKTCVFINIKDNDMSTRDENISCCVLDPKWGVKTNGYRERIRHINEGKPIFCVIISKDKYGNRCLVDPANIYSVESINKIGNGIVKAHLSNKIRVHSAEL